MSFSVGTDIQTPEAFPEALRKLAEKIPESQYARAEAVALCERLASVADAMFAEGMLGSKETGGWSASVSGHSNPNHAAQDSYAADEFVSLSLSHHSPATLDYYQKSRRSN